MAQSDHLSLLRIPACTLLRKSAPTTTTTITIWPDDASQQLQDCFDRTNWNIFEHPDLDLFNYSILCYIMTCTDTVTMVKCIRVFPNRSPG